MWSVYCRWSYIQLRRGKNDVSEKDTACPRLNDRHEPIPAPAAANKCLTFPETSPKGVRSLISLLGRVMGRCKARLWTVLCKQNNYCEKNQNIWFWNNNFAVRTLGVFQIRSMILSDTTATVSESCLSLFLSFSWIKPAGMWAEMYLYILQRNLQISDGFILSVWHAWQCLWSFIRLCTMLEIRR